KEEDQGLIFEPFQQLDMSSTRQYGGTGLGVTITNNLLQKMGSELNLKSTYGEGSTFYFELVLPYEDAKEQESGKNDVEGLKKPLSIKGKTVLIAEDNEINMRYADTALSMFSKDIRVVKANDGKEAYKLFLEHRPDLVLMDLIMPGIDGYQATRMIRNHDEQTPIVAMTAKAYSEDREACLKAGMNDFITKPVTLNQLKETVEKYLV
ncbi:MAG: response regulator, partial [Thermotogota bacterium]|nr:response regulator [Thermotogota bacterium]